MGLFTGIVIAIPMGPAGFESVRWTMLKGLKQGLLVVAGILIADSIDVMLINFGLLELIHTNKLLEVFFWILSGGIIFFIGYRAVKSGKIKGSDIDEESLEKHEIKSRPMLTGFVINFSNPMTHFFWLTLSSTVIRVWRSTGRLPYFIFAVSMLSGMFLSLYCINYLASRGKKIGTPKLSSKVSTFMAYGISIIGTCFFMYGLYKLFLIIK